MAWKTSEKLRDPDRLALIVICSALNLGLGFLVSTLKLPFYLDSIGTVLATAAGGAAVGVATAVLSVIVGSLYVPTLWAYAGTGVAIALYTAATTRLGYLQRIGATIIWGLILGVVAAMVSAPVTAYLWGGVSFSGSDAITAYFVSIKKTLLDSVILSGLSTDPVDKLITSLAAYGILRRLPVRFRVEEQERDK